MDFDDAYFTLMNGATLHHLRPFLESIGPRLEPEKPPPSLEELLEAGRWMLDHWRSETPSDTAAVSDDEVMAVVERDMYPAMLSDRPAEGGGLQTWGSKTGVTSPLWASIRERPFWSGRKARTARSMANRAASEWLKRGMARTR